MTPFEHDIIDLHIALENWLGKGEGDPAPCSPVSGQIF